MKAPRYLLGAAVLFWGWQTGFILLAAGMAAVLEGGRWLPRKWPLSGADLTWIWNICLLLFLGAALYSYSAEDLTYTALAFIQCLPMIFFPFMGVLACSTTERVNASTFLSIRRGPAAAAARGATLDARHPYFALILLSASAANVQDNSFYLGVSLLIAWALWAARPRRRRSWLTALLLAGVIGAGYAGHHGLRQLQAAWESQTVNWMAALRQHALEGRAYDTALGELGALKLSGHIVLRVEPDDPKRVPRLLREACYNYFNNGSWYGRRTGFSPLAKDEYDAWQVLPGQRATQTVVIACTLLNGRGALSLPPGAARISRLPASELERNRLGAVRANEGPSAIRYRVEYDPTANRDGPPDDLDLRVPDQEAATLGKIAEKLKLDGMKPEEAVRTVTAFFHDRFEYSIYSNPGPRESSEEGSALTRFLMSRRVGHCEYFAAATVLLLRQAGVPARYATGYAVTESARNGRTYVVRERHGHAWALVYVNGAWRDLDTTPPSWSDVEEKRARMFEPLLDVWSEISFKLSEVRWLFKSGALVPYLITSLAALVLFLAWRILARRQQARLLREKQKGRRAWPGVDSEFYLIEQRLAALGSARRTGETFAGWLRRVGAARPELIPGELLPSLLSVHNRYRFDPRGLNAEQRAVLSAQVRKCLDHLVRVGRIGLLLALALAVPARGADAFASVYLSEFMADNQHGLKDEDGDRPGWIELYNGGAATINLAGWFLTDNPAHLTKWRFPGVALLPEKYLVVFASGKDRTNDLAHLHTNFRLDQKGSHLALVGPGTNIVSEFGPVRLSADVSYGRVRGEPALSGPFLRPTPGRPNAMSGPGFAPEVIFSRASGNFTESLPVELATATNGAVIRYTLDGSLPISRSPIYGAPLLITNTACLRARAFAAGLLPGPPHGETYVKLHTNILDFTSTLPVLIMDTLGKETAASSHGSLVHLSLFEPVNGRTSLTNRPVLASRGSFHVRGSTSSGFPQSGFALQFVDEFNQEHPLPALGLPPDSDWVLYAPNAYDPVMIHNPFIHQLSRDLGRYSPRTRFVEVFVVRSAGRVKDTHYNGLYVLEEKIKIGKHRVDIDRLSPEDVKPPQVTGGYILKFDRVGPGESGFNASGDRGMVYVEPKEQIISLPQRAAQRQYLATFFNDFDRALHGPNWKDPALGYRAYLDVDAAIDFHVLEVLSGNVDAMVLSTYFHKPRDGKIVCGPHWDFDRALGSTDGRDDNPRQWNTGPFFSGAWWPRLFHDPDFWQLWVDRWQQLRGTHFSLTNLDGLIDRLAAEVREAQPREYARWGLQARGGSYQGEIDLMKKWLSNRVDFIDEQLVQPPRLNPPGGRIKPGSLLTLTAPTNATIYYTLDGSDPRLAQGSISSNAILYSVPIPLHTNTSVVARARNPNQRQSGGPPTSTPWSGRVTAQFIPSPP